MRFRSPLLSESRLISLPPGTEMVHFPGLARTRLCIQRAVCRFYRHGFPHSDIPGSKPVCGFPGLIAAYRVLHRLLAPRHPPYALSSLTIKLTQHVPVRIRIGTPQNIVTKGLASPRPVFCGVLCLALHPDRVRIPGSRTSRVWQVRLSTLRYSRAKLAVFCAMRTLISA